MDWVLRGPQIHSTFSSLGYIEADRYHVIENCNYALEEILKNILAEDTYLRNYRRNIGFGQNIERDLIPLLIHAKEDKTVDLVIRILVNLTVPVECLLDVEVISRTDLGRHTMFEINNLLASTKIAFMELRTSKAVIEFLKKNVDVEPMKKLSEEQLNNARNCLLLLRNILHIPELIGHYHKTGNESKHFVQNQLIWNMFSQSIDKVIIKAMTIRNSKFYAVTMVQLVALLYKDQHIVTLHKLLNNWHETSLSESSEDNESNTSPVDRGSDNSSPMLTFSDAASDSSDSSGPGSKAGSPTSANIWENGPSDDSGALCDSQPFRTCDPDIMDDDKYSSSQNNYQDNSVCDDKSPEAINEDHMKLECEMTDLANFNDNVDENNGKQVISDTSDCGYGTQFENQEFVSISSNDVDLPRKKPVHRKPHVAEPRPNNKPLPSTTLQAQKRRKIVKRVKGNVINVQGLFLKTPTDDDITNVIQEFTVDFLLKGYNSLVKALLNEILTNRELKINTSHFFWLLTYFLKFASQMELDWELIDSVLCFEIVSYLVAEGVDLCEQFELARKLNGVDLSSNIRTQHLIVSSIREFVQAVEVYKKIQLSNEAVHETLQKLQIKMSEAQDLSSLLVLLLRHYDARYHSKQYLRDLVVTNHILLTFLDKVMQIPEYKCSAKLIGHIRQFATPAIMAQYGLLLEDYNINGEFVNGCIFTLMHHVGGDGNSLDTLLQPKILKTFSAIWKSEFEISDYCNDLLQNCIHAFVRKTNGISCPLFLKQNGRDNIIFRMDVDAEKAGSKETVQEIKKINNSNTASQTADNTPQEQWSDNEISTLSWNYLQCSGNTDVIGAITKQLKDDNIDKSGTSVIRELYRQNLITKDFYESQLKGDKNTTTVQMSQESRDEEIGKACEQLILEGKSYGLEWVQKVLLEICFAKLLKQRKELQDRTPLNLETKFKNFACFRNKHDDMLIVSPVVYHSLITQESVPLVPWNCQQTNICKDVKFLQLLCRLGFEMPLDTGRVFIRIPYVWTAEFIYTVAGKILPIDTSTLKFSVCDLSNNENTKTKEYHTSDVIKDGPFVENSNNSYQMHKRNIATNVNFTPRPPSTFTSANAIEQLNWLQIVKKSQQCKLTLNLKSTNEAKTEDTKSPFGDDNTAGHFAPFMLPTTRVSQPATSVMLPSTHVMPPITPGMLLTTCCKQPVTSSMIPSTYTMEPMPSVMLPTLGIKQESAPQYMQREECCNSVRDTALELTYMYVSDGEAKPDVIARPGIAVAGGCDAITGEPAAGKKIKSRKRRREQIKRIKRTTLPSTIGLDD